MRIISLAALAVFMITCQQQAFKTNTAQDESYPSPFSPTITFYYEVPHADTVTLVIYNTQGQIMDTVVHSFELPGKKTVTANEAKMKNWPVGVYFYSVTVGDSTYVKKWMLLR